MICQLMVPAPSPPAPKELVHFTAVTPTLSDAVPVTSIVADEVETIETLGERICKLGGVVSAVVC